MPSGGETHTAGGSSSASGRGLRCVVFDGNPPCPRWDPSGRNTGGASVKTGRSRRLRMVALAATFGALAFVLSGCSLTDALALGWPKGITPEAHLNRELWIGSVAASFVVGGIV